MPKHKYRTALLIDDNFIDCLINKKLLEITDFAQEIVCLQSAEEALTYLKNLINAQKPLPEVIFVDIRMPVKDGFDFLDEFKLLNNKPETVKIIVVSSSLDPADHKKVAANNNVFCFAVKPLTIELLNSF